MLGTIFSVSLNFSLKRFVLLWPALYSSFLFMFLSFPIKVSLKNYIFPEMCAPKEGMEDIQKGSFSFENLNICLLYNRLCKTVIYIQGHTFITSTKSVDFDPLTSISSNVNTQVFFVPSKGSRPENFRSITPSLLLICLLHFFRNVLKSSLYL